MTDAELIELSAYLDGELDAATMARIKARLASDADTRRILERLTTADDYFLRTARTFGFRPDATPSWVPRHAAHNKVAGTFVAVAMAWALGRAVPNGEAWLAFNLGALVLVVVILARLALSEVQNLNLQPGSPLIEEMTT